MATYKNNGVVARVPAKSKTGPTIGKAKKINRLRAVAANVDSKNNNKSPRVKSGNDKITNSPPKFTAAHQLAVLRRFRKDASLSGQENLLTDEDKMLIEGFKKLTKEEQDLKIAELFKPYMSKGRG